MIYEVAFGQARKGFCLHCGVAFIIVKGELRCFLCDQPLTVIENYAALATIEGVPTKEGLAALAKLLDITLKEN